MRILILSAICILTVACAVAQPATDIYLFDLELTASTVVLSNPKNITKRAGYDNQPHFHPEQSLLYFVSADTTGATDIFEFNYTTGQQRRITQTSDREYSPTVTPDKKHLSCILQTAKGAQHLVRYPIAGGNADTLINDKVVGYHAWATPDKVLIFTLPQPFKLELVDIASGQDTTIAESIGRSIHRAPRGLMSFVKKVADNDYEIRLLNANTLEVLTLSKALPGVEHDMAWTPDGKALMSEGTNLYFNSGDTWIRAEFSGGMAPGIISRIAVSPDAKKIALVIAEK